MKHPSTRAVYAYWNEKRGHRAAPDRADIDPAAIRHALGDTFMLAADFVDELRFRLAGTRVCALFCHEIKGEAFAELWSEDSRERIEALLAILHDETLGAVAGVTARTADGSDADLEILLLPLAHVGHARIRALGVLAPVVPPYWLGEKPVVELVLGTLRHIGPETERLGAPQFASTPVGGRRRHGFVVYSGGREMSSGERTG
ncbi:MAG: PAS domain-containing protein [Rhizobiales bacterium]|nr:PAS domain-containing protein [Hyphomicrobiales bacterium]